VVTEVLEECSISVYKVEVRKDRDVRHLYRRMTNGNGEKGRKVKGMGR
jgi:hypothetical protein